MQVDFNNLRKQTAYAFNNLVDILNTSIDDYDEDKIRVNIDDIQDDINKLRSCIWGLLCCYQENDDSIRDLSDEVELKNFNNEE